MGVGRGSGTGAGVGKRNVCGLNALLVTRTVQLNRLRKEASIGTESWKKLWQGLNPVLILRPSRHN